MGPGLVCGTLRSQATDPGSAGASYIHVSCSNSELGINKDVLDCLCEDEWLIQRDGRPTGGNPEVRPQIHLRWMTLKIILFLDATIVD